MDTGSVQRLRQAKQQVGAGTMLATSHGLSPLDSCLTLCPGGAAVVAVVGMFGLVLLERARRGTVWN
jgi:hypothetical protein